MDIFCLFGQYGSCCELKLENLKCEALESLGCFN